MTPMIDIHMGILENRPEAYLCFLLDYKPNKKVLYGFVEGKEDPCFYQGALEGMLPNGWDVQLRAAGSKEKVFEIYNNFDWLRYDKLQIVFFIDRDHAEFGSGQLISDTNIYITDGYSVENSIVNVKTCKRVLCEVCELSSARQSEIKGLEQMFNRGHEEFCRYMIPITASIIRWRKTDKKMNLNQINLNKIFEFIEGNLELKENYKDKKELIKCIHDMCNIKMVKKFSITRIEKKLTTDSSYIRNTRGKFLIWFLVYFCLSVFASYRKLCPSVSRKLRMHSNLSTVNAMMVIAPRSRAPESLINFVKNTFHVYIAKIEQQVVS